MTSFTLAEVLIVLGIIGLIADMTIPTLINNTQKKVAEVRIKKFYTNMSQAITLSEIDNGPQDQWNRTMEQTTENAKKVFNEYMAPYLIFSSITDSLGGIYVNFNDSSSMQFRIGSCLDMFFDVNGNKKPGKWGKDIFPFIICGSAKESGNSKFRSYPKWEWKNNPPQDRNEYLQTCKTDPFYCTPLIEYDGWQIKDDYPWY